MMFSNSGSHTSNSSNIYKHVLIRFIMKLNKRGLSDVVTTGLIILLAIAAVIIVWSFIRPAITTVGESINTECITIELAPVKCIANAVDVKMGSGSTTLKGVKLIYYDSSGNSQARDASGTTFPKALETLTLNPTPAPTITPTFVKVAGVIEVSAGKLQTCPDSVSQVICN